MNINLGPFDETNLIEATKKQFPDAFIKIDKNDLFMKEVNDGTYTCNFREHPIYISTQYAYEDILVNENPTRYKIHIATLELIDHDYGVNYSWTDRYYAVYEELGQIKFMEYMRFLEFIKKEIQMIEQ